MIFTDRTIIVQKGTSSINDTIILYRGDRDIEVRFTLNEGSPFKFGSGASPNIIEKTEAAYGQLIIKTPNDLPAIFSEVVPTNNGKIVFAITAEMIDEITEVGNYTFQIRLLDESRNSRATIPEVVNGIEIREPIATEDISDTNEVGIAAVGYALTTAGTQEDAFDSQGNYNKTTWGTGDRITAAKLNKIEAGIDGVNKKVASGGTGGGVANSVDWSNVQNKPTIPTNTSQLTNDSGFITNVPDEYITETELNAKGYATTSQIPTVPTNVSEFTNDANYASETYVTNKIAEAQLGGDSGTVDLSGYVTKETGNASQITFSDGQTFQSKLDAGTLKGDKGDAGEQGPQGPKGDTGEQGPAGVNGQDGLTTAISVNGSTYEHVGGIITLPNYPDVSTVDLSEYAKTAEVNVLIQEYSGGKKQVYLTQAEYDILSDEEKNNKDIVYNITDAETTLKAENVVFNDGQTFQAKLDAGTLKGDTGEQGPQGPAGADGLTTSISLNGVTYTQENGVITLPNITSGGNIPSVTQTEPQELDMPKVFFYGTALPTSKTDVNLTMDYVSNTTKFSSYIKLKCQGTSSMSYAKKNFTINMYSDEARSTKLKKDFKGWGAQSKFCLKANYVDTTHTRNISGARIAYDMVTSRPDSPFKQQLLQCPRNGAVDGFPIKLYFNGEFYGIYTWNIPKDGWMFNMDKSNPNHVVLCAERNTDGNSSLINSCQFRKLWTDGDGGDWSVEFGTYSTDLQTKFNRVIAFVKDSTDEEFKANISQYLDLYSVIDYYCFSYLCCHLDGLAKNMLMVTYDGNIWGCSLYDMDSIFGVNWNGNSYVATNYQCPEQYQEQFSLLWPKIERCFGNELYQRYLELRRGALSLSNIIKHVEEIYDVIPDRVFADEKAKWTSLPQVNTNTMTRFRNYMRDRAVYVDTEMGRIGNSIPCTGIVLNVDTLSFTTADTQTLSVVVSPDNCTDAVTWSVSPSGIVTVDNGVVTPVANGECTITATCGSYSDTCAVTVSGMSESGGDTDISDGYMSYLIQYQSEPICKFTLHAASTSTDCQGFECSPSFEGFAFPTDVNDTDTSYMICDSMATVTDSEKKVNNIPCISGAYTSPRNYLTVKVLKTNASTTDEFKTYFNENLTYIKIKAKDTVQKYNIDIDNIEMLTTSHSMDGYTRGEFIANDLPATNYTAANVFMSNLGFSDDWRTYDWSYFKIVEWQNQVYVGFQIKNELLETQDLEGIKKYIAKDPNIYYIN